jgi:hypothetical protein
MFMGTALLSAIAPLGAALRTVLASTPDQGNSVRLKSYLGVASKSMLAARTEFSGHKHLTDTAGNVWPFCAFGAALAFSHVLKGAIFIDRQCID